MVTSRSITDVDDNFDLRGLKPKCNVTYRINQTKENSALKVLYIELLGLPRIK
jgi:hypothetical protein